MDNADSQQENSKYETSAPKTRKLWACDVCKTNFPDYNEACRHEEACRQQQQQQQEATEEAKTNESTTNTTTMSQGWRCDVCQKAFADYNEACCHEEACRKRAAALASTTDNNSKPIHPFFAKDKQGNKGNERKNKKVDETVVEIVHVQQEAASRPMRKRKAPKKQTAEPTKKAKSSAKTSSTTASKPQQTKKKKQQTQSAPPPLASIFAGGASSQAIIMAQHDDGAAEFAAKRRANAERERQRQKRRQQQKQEKLKESSQREMENLLKNRPRLSLELRFPVFSHVISPQAVMPNVNDRDSATAWIDQDSLSKAQGRLGKSLRHLGSEKSTNETKTCTPLLLPPNNKQTLFVAQDPLQEALSNLLVPPETPSDSSTEAWCNKYSIQNVPDNVCGESNKETARELLKFVNEWKMERGRAHERRAEKQQALLKKRKKKRRYHDDDIIWQDSDEEDGMYSVCLLTGPSGSGKTSLVHAVARQSDCVVLEINTTERRGGAALKNAIEEATQSDSSLDMLKKNKIVADADPLVDSDDDEHEETGTKGSSIIVVLIDEVDIIFEDEGDSGFWSAMSTLTKKAKCPIFLTANNVPDSLVSSHIRYLHLEMSPPKPEECVVKMRRILRSEGLGRTESFADGPAANKQLSLIAQLCKCDLRRVMNELQLFATAPPPLPSTDGPASMDCEASAVTKYDSIPEYLGPVISDISPREVSPHDLTLITVRGSRFAMGNVVEVSIGSQASPAVKVVDDSTILAVCPPCFLGPGVTDSGVIEQTGQESRTTRFAPVSIKVYSHGKIQSSSDVVVISTTKLCDGTPYTSLGRQWNVEYAFPPPRYGMQGNQQAQSDDESVEAEFGGDESTRKALPVAAPTEAAPQRTFTATEAEAMLEQGVREWKAIHVKSEASSETKGARDETIGMTDAASSNGLEELSSLTKLSSDAAFLDDGLEFGTVPFLSGVVPGFGSSLVNDLSGSNKGGADKNAKKLLRDANARPPNFERLYLLGWNEDGCFFGNSEAYASYPISTRERQLLARSEDLERGLSRALSLGASSSDSYQEDDDHHDTQVSESLSETIKLHESPRRLSEEDMLVKPCSSQSILSFPNSLRQHVLESGHEPIDRTALVCLPKAAQDKACRMAQLLSDFLEEDVDPSANRLLYQVSRLAATTIVPLQDRMNDGLFLDYLPMLCDMAMQERAAEHAFQQLCQADPESAAAMTGRGGRTTRRSRKTLERRHYFVTARNCSEDSVANAIGSELAKHVLHYDSK